MKKIFSFLAICFFSVSVFALSAPAVNVAEAIEIGMALEAGATTDVVYEVTGYVINAESFSLMYHNQTWSMADDANAASSDFKAYHCFPIDNGDTIKVLNGDKVTVVGKLKKYVNNNTQKTLIEIEQGDASFVEKTDVDHTVYEMTAGVTVGRALQIGAALGDNETTVNQYVIRGYVSAIATPFSSQHKNESFWVTESDNSTAASNDEGAFYVYRGKPETGEELVVGTQVEFVTTIKKYVPEQGDPVIENADQNIVIRVLVEAPEDSADVIFKGEDFYGLGQMATEETPGGTVSVTKNGVTFLCNNAYGDQYGVRCYAGGEVTISSDTKAIEKLVFEFSSANGKYYNGGLENEIEVNAAQWTNTMASQARMNKIKVFLKETEEPNEGIENVILTEQVQKVVVEGVLYIVRDGKMYNLQGMQVR